MNRWSRGTVVATLVGLAWQSGVEGQEKGDSVLNEAGIPIKVITTRDCKLYEDADGSSKGAPCPVFKYWYVLPPEPNAPSREAAKLPSIKKNGFYRVASGDGEAEARGWVREADVIEWHHREAVQFTPRSGRKTARFYKTEAEAIKAVESGEEGAPTHEEPESAGGAVIIMPLLKVSPRKVKDENVRFLETGFVSGKPPAAPAPTDGGAGGQAADIKESAGLTKADLRKRTTVDIVFVVDTTNSMGPPIEQVRKSIAAAAQMLAADPERKARLRFGLVAYRDVHPEAAKMEYVTRVFCTLEEGKDHKLFEERVASLQVAQIGSIDYAEDVLAGLWEATEMDRLLWNPLAWKQIVVVGDASIKEAGHPQPVSQTNHNSRTIDQIKAKAQPGTGVEKERLNSNFVISVIHLRDPEAADDHENAARQFTRLVSGREYSGNLIPVRGGKDTEDFAGALADDIVKKINTLWNIVVTPPDPSKPPTPPPASVTAADFPITVLRLLEKLPDGSSAPIEGFSSRFCGEFDHDGNKLFSSYAFTRKGTLQNFQSFLHVLKNALEDSGPAGARNVEGIVDTLKVVCASLLSGSPKVDKDFQPDEFIKMVTGFPVKTPIFAMTLEKITAMSQADYDEWVKGINACDQTLKSLIENPNIWVKLHPDAKDRQMHAFIRLSDLP